MIRERTTTQETYNAIHRQADSKCSGPMYAYIDPELGEKLLKKGQSKKVGKHYYRIWNGMTLHV